MSDQKASDLTPSAGQLYAGWRAGNRRYQRQALGRRWMMVASATALASGLAGLLWMLLQSF